MAEANVVGVSHDLRQLLFSHERDFLVRNNGDQVEVSCLVGRPIGLYFSAKWCGPCRYFTPVLEEAYREISSSKGDFEVVFISKDWDEESFNEYFSKMPWLAVPFSDEGARRRLEDLFKVKGIPHLVFLDSSGEVTCKDGTEILRNYGVEAYPFTTERLAFCREQEEIAKNDQSLRSLLVSGSRDYLISNHGTKVPVSDLKGKLVGLYISVHSHPFCVGTTPKLVEVYKQLKTKGENFEIVLISADQEEEEFKKDFEAMPWLALPFEDKSRIKLLSYFDIVAIPQLILIGEDGKTLNPNVIDFIEEHGAAAYPFSPEKLSELSEVTKTRLESQTLESVLVHGEKDFLIDKSGSKVPVSELVGKTILLYFSATWFPDEEKFLSKLIEAYHEIKAKDNAFEVIFISSDLDQSSYDAFHSRMPWLALPFGDERRRMLQQKFKILGPPTIIVLGPSGKTINRDARKMIEDHWADAYPFTEDHVKELEGKPKVENERWICEGDTCRKV